jgi:hypothetical protein
MSTSDEIIKAKLGAHNQSKAVGQNYGGEPSAEMFGSFTGNIDQQVVAYGFRKDNARNAPSIGISLPVQATNYMKKVNLVGYVGVAETFRASTWMRVYREVYAPCSEKAFRDYIFKERYYTPDDPCVPYFGARYGLAFEGAGSTLGNVTAQGGTGPYQMLWLRWKSGEGKDYGVLFDWYRVLPDNPSKFAHAKIDLDAKPKDVYSKSKSAAFATTAINSYTSNGLKGVNLGSIKDDPNTIYYLQDDSSEPVPKLQSSIPKEALIAPKIDQEPVTLSGQGSLKLASALPIGTAPKVEIGKLISVSGVQGGSGATKLVYTGIVGKIGSTYEALYFSEEDGETIMTHIDNAAETFGKAQFSETNGKKIVVGTNVVKPSYKFGTQPQHAYTWTPQPLNRGSGFLRTAVVDGFNLPQAANIPPPNQESWVSGYAPASTSTNDLNAARAKYWYVLPVQQRRSEGAGFIFTGATSSYQSEFTSAAPFVGSLHFGKFLKSTENSDIGFSSGDLEDYQTNLEIEATNAVNERLDTSRFTAFTIKRYSGPPGQYIASTITRTIDISLRNVEGVSVASSYTGWTESQVNSGNNYYSSPWIGAGRNPSNPSTPTPGASTGTYTGPPKDWRKLITDATSKLVSGASVQSLTAQHLEQFLRQQVNLGAPLQTLQEIFFQQLLEAKVVALMQTSGLSRIAAIAAVKQDPLYISLTKFAASLTPKPRTRDDGGTASNSTNSARDQNQTTTIKIDVIRGLPGYRQGIRESGATIADQPELVQTYDVFSNGPAGSAVLPKPRRFVFPFVPREVNYTGIGTQWTEIARTGNYPIVDWTGFQLLKISFNFDVVDRTFESQTGFGLYFSCEEQLRQLREMAQTPYPVTFLNMDKFMREEVRWPTLSQGRGIEFVIAEFSVTAVQRTSSDAKRAASVVPNQISRATCSMTLQEIPIETVSIVQMPPIKPCKKKCDDIPKIPEEKFKEYLLLTTGVAVSRG